MAKSRSKAVVYKSSRKKSKSASRRRPGHPKGSKNKSFRKKSRSASRRGPGRPKGSKNKSKSRKDNGITDVTYQGSKMSLSGLRNKLGREEGTAVYTKLYNAQFQKPRGGFKDYYARRRDKKK